MYQKFFKVSFVVLFCDEFDELNTGFIREVI